MIYLTITTKNNMFLPMLMAKSLKTVEPRAKLVVCILEEEIPSQVQQYRYFDHVVLAKDLGFDNFFSHIFRIKDIEACTSVKAQLFLYCLNQFPHEEKFVYLDGDVKVYGPFTEIQELLDSHSIIVTPHTLNPEISKDRVEKSEIFLLKFGLFNAGFIAIRRNENSLKFLSWWANRIEMFCHIDIKNGIFVDQKWLDYAPVFFETYILKHPGYNVASWNLSHRNLEIHPDGYITVNGYQLKFFHFSGILRVEGDYEELFKHFVPNLNDCTNVYPLVTEYIHELRELGQDFNHSEPWSYNYFHSGEQISPYARTMFRENMEKYSDIHNPFIKSNLTFLPHYNPRNNSQSLSRSSNQKNKKKIIRKKRRNKSK